MSCDELTSVQGKSTSWFRFVCSISKEHLKKKRKKKGVGGGGGVRFESTQLLVKQEEQTCCFRLGSYILPGSNE